MKPAKGTFDWDAHELATARRIASKVGARELSDVQIMGISDVASLPYFVQGGIGEARGNIVKPRRDTIEESVFDYRDNRVAAFWSAFMRHPEATMKLLLGLWRESERQYARTAAWQIIRQVLHEHPGAKVEQQLRIAAEHMRLKPSKKAIQSLAVQRKRMLRVCKSVGDAAEWAKFGLTPIQLAPPAPSPAKGNKKRRK